MCFLPPNKQNKQNQHSHVGQDTEELADKNSAGLRLASSYGEGEETWKGKFYITCKHLARGICIGALAVGDCNCWRHEGNKVPSVNTSVQSAPSSLWLKRKHRNSKQDKYSEAHTREQSKRQEGAHRIRGHWICEVRTGFQQLGSLFYLNPLSASSGVGLMYTNNRPLITIVYGSGTNNFLSTPQSNPTLSS